MKTTSKFLLPIIATIAMSACNNDLDNGSLNNNRTVTFKMGIGETASSRVSMGDDAYSATFEKNDAVGIFVKDQQSYSNIKYTTADGSTWTGGTINLAEGGEYTYYAYYPYSESVTTTNNIPFNVASNQDTEGYIKNDFLYSSTTSKETNVTLAYNHALSLVDVTLDGNLVGDDATVNIINVATDATINLETPSVTTGENKADINMDVLGNKRFRAIIPAQSIAASTPIFRIETKGKTYEAKYNGEVKFEQGKFLSLTITINKDEEPTPEIEITFNGSINDWTNGGEIVGDGSVEEKPVELLDLSSLEGINIESLIVYQKWDTDKITGDDDFWYKRNVNSFVDYSVEDNAIVLKTKTETAKDKQAQWHSDCIGFHSSGKYELAKYTLTFEMKTGFDNCTIGVGIAESKDKGNFKICKGDWSSFERNVHTINKAQATDWEKQTLNFDFNEYFEGGKSSGIDGNTTKFTTSTEDNVKDGINLFFYNYTKANAENTGTIYIRNIKLQRVTE